MRLSALLLLVTASSISAQSLDTTNVRNPGPLARTIIAPDSEAVLALSAAPPEVRANATVYVFGATGYQLHHKGSSGFVCLVNRDSFLDGYDALKPTCWDPEGARTIVPMVLMEGADMAAGKSGVDIARRVDEAFRKQELQPPARAGIAYMLQGDVTGYDAQTNTITTRGFPPHVMFYAPGVKESDVMMGRPSTARPFLYRRSPYHGYFIAPLPTR